MFLSKKAGVLKLVINSFYRTRYCSKAILGNEIADDSENGITIIGRNNLGALQAGIYAFKGKVYSKGEIRMYQPGHFKQSNIGHFLVILYFNPSNEKKVYVFGGMRASFHFVFSANE